MIVLLALLFAALVAAALIAPPGLPTPEYDR